MCSFGRAPPFTCVFVCSVVPLTSAYGRCVRSSCSPCHCRALIEPLKKAKRLLLLSGTPALARPEELYTNLDALTRGEFGSWITFVKRYCNARHVRGAWRARGALVICHVWSCRAAGGWTRVARQT